MFAETEKREKILSLLEQALHVAGSTDISFHLKESARRPDIVEIYSRGRYIREACVEDDSLTAMMVDVLEACT